MTSCHCVCLRLCFNPLLSRTRGESCFNRSYAHVTSGFNPLLSRTRGESVSPLLWCDYTTVSIHSSREREEKGLKTRRHNGQRSFQSTPLANERRKGPRKGLYPGIFSFQSTPLANERRKSCGVVVSLSRTHVSIHSSREREEKDISSCRRAWKSSVSIHSSREREEKGWITSCRYLRAGFQSTPLANERRKKTAS